MQYVVENKFVSTAFCVKNKHKSYNLMCREDDGFDI